MINTKDQEELFKLISNYLEKDITCIAIGGTAMMFAGYKNTTKDIDLVFKNPKDRNTFIKAIKQIGYKEKTIGTIYDEKRKKHSNKPVMFSRGEERFDLFVKNIFGYELSFEQKEITQREDFIGKQELIIQILSKEELILLKSITRREKDHEDIVTILEIEKDINWELLINNAIRQQQNLPWILIDLEETLQELKKQFFIKEEYFKLIYNNQKK